MAEDMFDTLIQVFRDRAIPYDRKALEAAYNDPENGPQLHEWIREYLTPETLLSKDEAALYAALVKSGEADRLVAQDLSQVQALNDHELETAIEELKRSTAAIEKQTEALKLQQSALNSLIKNERKTKDARAQAEEGQLRKWDVERAKMSEEVEELSQSLSYQTADLEQQGREKDISFKRTVDGVLRTDDKLLLSLQKLASDLEPANPESDDAIGRIRDLCARIIKYTVEGVRTRLDRVYLEALGNDTANGNGVESQEAADLQEELESLYAEILPVAQMSAEQQFLQPALRILESTDGRSRERAEKAFKYINDCLLFLIDRTDTLLRRAEESQSHNVALKFVLGEAKKELSQPLVSSAKAPLSPTRSNTPRRRKSSTTQSPLKVRHLRRRSSGSAEGLEPEHQLARNLGITLPSEVDSGSVRIEAMEQVLSDRLLKLGLHSESLRTSTETGISSHLQNAHGTLQLLQDTLLSETPYGNVKLLDPEIVGSVDTFEQDIQYVQSSMEEIDLQVLHGNNVKRDQIIERWSR